MNKGYSAQINNVSRSRIYMSKQQTVEAYAELREKVRGIILDYIRMDQAVTSLADTVIDAVVESSYLECMEDEPVEAPKRFACEKCGELNLTEPGMCGACAF